jgi:antitoxin component YwqK of YwqJK toxin-antitoxin module
MYFRVLNFYISVLILVVFTSCDREGIGPKKLTDGTYDSIVPVENGVSKSFFKNGKPKLEITFKNGKYDGPAKNFYPSGACQAAFMYKDGKKSGTETIYYENGKPYLVSNYTNGKRNGLRKMYWDTGELMAELEYKDGEPQPGLKEYKRDGKKLTKYPHIVFKTQDKTAFDGIYIVKAMLSGGERKVKFYQYSKAEQQWLKLQTKNGEAKWEFYVGKGNLMERFQLKAHYITPYRNILVLNATKDIAFSYKSN